MSRFFQKHYVPAVLRFPISTPLSYRSIMSFFKKMVKEFEELKDNLLGDDDKDKKEGKKEEKKKEESSSSEWVWLMQVASFGDKFRER